jgi:hypothetical protein
MSAARRSITAAPPAAAPRSDAGPSSVAASAIIRMRGEGGQSSVELIALLPLVLIVALGAASLLGARAASGQAAAAAQAGAMAILQDEDPRAAAREALPAAARGRSTVTVRGRRVAVEVRPRSLVPFLSAALAASASASAGAAP